MTCPPHIFNILNSHRKCAVAEPPDQFCATLDSADAEVSARPPTELYLVRGRTYDVHVSILSGTQHVRTRGVEMNLILELSPAGSASPGSALSARESARRVESGAACDGDGRSPHACFEQTPTALGPRSLVVELPLPNINASESESGLRPGAAAEVRCGPR